MKNPVENQKQGRRKFDAQFKEHAVKLWLDSGKAARTVGEELGIRHDLLYCWKKRHEPKSPMGGGRGTWVQIPQWKKSLR